MKSFVIFKTLRHKPNYSGILNKTKSVKLYKPFLVLLTLENS